MIQAEQGVPAVPVSPHQQPARDVADHDLSLAPVAPGNGRHVLLGDRARLEALRYDVPWLVYAQGLEPLPRGLSRDHKRRQVRSGQRANLPFVEPQIVYAGHHPAPEVLRLPWVYGEHPSVPPVRRREHEPAPHISGQREQPELEGSQHPLIGDGHEIWIEPRKSGRSWV
jgi:hypothetical protein